MTVKFEEDIKPGKCRTCEYAQVDSELEPCWTCQAVTGDSFMQIVTGWQYPMYKLQGAVNPISRSKPSSKAVPVVKPVEVTAPAAIRLDVSKIKSLMKETAEVRDILNKAVTEVPK